MTLGVLWVVAAALLFGAGAIAQAAATTGTHGGLAAVVRRPWFVAGTLAEALGALAHLLALQTTSMAVAQGAVSGSLAVTAVGARLLSGRRLGVGGALAVVALGAALTALALVSGDPGAVTDIATWTVLLAAATLVVAIGATVANTALRPALRGPALAVVSGLGFAACSISGRLLGAASPPALLTDAALLVLVAAGALGCLCWTLALRRTGVTTVTAIVVVAEVVPPSLLGPLLGDDVGSWFALVAPAALAVAAAAGVVLARREGAAVGQPAAPRLAQSRDDNRVRSSRSAASSGPSSPVASSTSACTVRAGS